MTLKFRNEQQAADAFEKAQRELDGVTEQIRALVGDHRVRVNRVLKDEMIHQGGRVYRSGEIGKETLGKLRGLEAQAKAAKEAAKEATDYLTRDQRTATEQARDDGRMRLAWERAQMMLAAGIPAHEITRRAAEQDDRLTVEAMEFFAPTYMEADIRGRDGSLNDIGHQFEALTESLKSAKAETAPPAVKALADLGETGDAVDLIATRAADEIRGGDPVVSLHVDGGDFSGNVHIARENKTLLSRMGGGDVVRRAS